MLLPNKRQNPLLPALIWHFPSPWWLFSCFSVPLIPVVRVPWPLTSLPAACVEAHSARFHPLWLWTETVRLTVPTWTTEWRSFSIFGDKISSATFFKVRHKELYGAKKPENHDHRLKADLKAWTDDDVWPVCALHHVGGSVVFSVKQLWSVFASLWFYPYLCSCWRPENELSSRTCETLIKYVFGNSLLSPNTDTLKYFSTWHSWTVPVKQLLVGLEDFSPWTVIEWMCEHDRSRLKGFLLERSL